MSETTEEETFKQYSEEQVKTYARNRPDYSDTLYNTVLQHHASTGGRDGLLLDVGCGPGNVTRALAGHFQRAVGLDASPSMVRQARAITLAQGTRTKSAEPLYFFESSAESLGMDDPEHHSVGVDDDDDEEDDDVMGAAADIKPASVDLITVANAAHWFDMPRFWHTARTALRPNGTVALWIPGEGRVHPSTPGAEALDALIQRFTERDVLPYYAPGNFLFRNRYRDLPLPWTMAARVDGFEQEAFQRREWGVSSSSDGAEAVMHEEPFVAGGDRMVSMDLFEASVGTMSPVTRWRAAHPDIAGTDEDIVRILRRDMEKVLRQHGAAPGEERLRMVMDGTLLLVKRRA